VVEGGSEDVADYRGEMDELARTAYETHSAEFQEERTEIIKNIKAIKEYKSQLLQAQITELEGAKERQKIDSQQDYGQSGFIATMSDFDVRTLTSDIEYTKKEIAEADDNLINFDKNIENLREEILATEKPVEDFSADLGGVGGGAKKAKDGVEELEDAIDDLEDQTKDMEKANEDYLETSEDLKDANHKFYKAIKDDLRDVGDAIEDVNEKYKTTVDDIIDRRSKLFGNNASNFARSQAEGETKTKEDILDLEEKLSELQHERIDEEDEEKKREKILENAEKQLEIEQEITEEKAKLLRIQENLNTLNQQLVDEERDRAGLSDEERALGDFENTQKEVARNAQAELLKAEQARDAELKKLEQKKRILEVFQNHELTSVKQLNDLLENEKILALDTDMFRLLERLALERIELIQLNDKKKGLADDLYSYTTQLENNFYNTVSGNVDRLTAKYRTLVETIRSAIAEQNIQNNQSRASGRVDG
jgi:predicted  nucleic acid-binding Zn-ribbon protein